MSPVRRILGRLLPFLPLCVALFWQIDSAQRGFAQRESAVLAERARRGAAGLAAEIADTRAMLARLDSGGRSCPAILAAGAAMLRADGTVACGTAPWPDATTPRLGGTAVQQAVRVAQAARSLALVRGPAGPVLVQPAGDGWALARAISPPRTAGAPWVVDLEGPTLLGGVLPPAGLWRAAHGVPQPHLAAAALPPDPTLPHARLVVVAGGAIDPPARMPGAMALAAGLLAGLALAWRSAAPTAHTVPKPTEDATALALWDRHAGNLIVWLDPDLTPRRISASSVSLLGMGAEALMAQPCGLPVTHDDLPRLRGLAADARAGHRAGPIPLRLRRADGGLAWLDVTATPDDHGGIVLAGRDISALRAAEAQLSLARHHVATLALEDPLTGLANRRRFDDALVQECRRAQREAQPLSLLVLTPEHFAAYRDRQGHVRGEALLRRVGRAIAAALQRPGDLAARGDEHEFCVLLPATNAVGAAIVAQRLRRAVRALHIAHPLAPAGIVTLAIGIAWIGQGTNPPAMLAAARAAQRPDEGEPSDQSVASGASDLMRSETRLRTAGSEMR